MNKIKQGATTADIISNKHRPIFYDDFLALKQELISEIKSIAKAQFSSEGKQWLKGVEVRKLLNVSAGTLYTLRKNGTLPYTRIGGAVFYNAADINKMMNTHSFNHQ